MVHDNMTAMCNPSETGIAKKLEKKQGKPTRYSIEVYGLAHKTVPYSRGE